MKRLTLLRHAKSDWGDPAARDFDRALNERGKKGAATVGRHMRSLGLVFDAVVSSPAVRCIDTLDGLWDGFGKTLHPSWDRRIYLASGVTLLDVVNDTDEGVESLLMCGHNPGLEDLILMLVPDTADDRLRDDVEEKFPTASFAEVEFDGAWADLRSKSAHLTRFVRPRDLDPALGPER